TLGRGWSRHHRSKVRLVDGLVEELIAARGELECLAPPAQKTVAALHMVVEAVLVFRRQRPVETNLVVDGPSHGSLLRPRLPKGAVVPKLNLTWNSSMDPWV